MQRNVPYLGAVRLQSVDGSFDLVCGMGTRASKTGEDVGADVRPASCHGTQKSPPTSSRVLDVLDAGRVVVAVGSPDASDEEIVAVVHQTLECRFRDGLNRVEAGVRMQRKGNCSQQQQPWVRVSAKGILRLHDECNCDLRIFGLSIVPGAASLGFY